MLLSIFSLLISIFAIVDRSEYKIESNYCATCNEFASAYVEFDSDL